MPIIPTLWKLRQEDLEFKAILDDTARPYFKFFLKSKSGGGIPCL